MVKDTLLDGDVIEDYPEDEPLPSALFLGWHVSLPLHVVAAFDSNEGTVYIITAYQPDSEHFMDNFRARRKHGS